MERHFEHSGYVRCVEGSKYAVLMLHGIAGTPAHFNMLYDAIPQDFSIYNMPLEGHSKGVEDFGRASMSAWKEQARNMAKEILKKHEYIICVAHSMGCLFSIRLAIEDPERIKGLFLLAVPLRPLVKIKTNIACIRLMLGFDKHPSPLMNKIKNATGIHLVPKPWKYIRWIPRLLELVVETQRVRGFINKLDTPCKTYQSKNDELVAFSSCKDMKNISCISNTVLHSSGHFDYSQDDIEILNQGFAELLKEIT
ncbi:MAG: alpha/beta fold hydrolase [Clostridia bacterium]|nr:alpha/beta fold hydrolase [Clostridia bacterium]